VPSTLRPMLASLTDAPLEIPSGLRTEVRRIRAIAEIAPKGPYASGRAWATKRRVSFPRSPRARTVVTALKARSSRRRDRRARREGRADGIPEAQGRIHLDDAAAGDSPSAHSAHSATTGSSRSTSSATGGPTSAIARCSNAARRSRRCSPDEGARRHARKNAPRSCASAGWSAATDERSTGSAGQRLGGADCQARGLVVQVGQALTRLRKLKSRPRAGVRVGG